MGQTAEELRADIARRRDDMSLTLDEIGDRVSPRQMVRRRTSGIQHWMRSARAAVMGTAADTYGQARNQVGAASDRMQGAAQGATGKLHGATDGLRSAPGTITGQARGNPLAAGLVAFGVGVLIGSLAPATDTEQRMVAAAGDQAAPVVEEARQAAGELAAGMKESAQAAANGLQAAAKEAASEVKNEAAAAGQDVVDTVRGS